MQAQVQEIDWLSGQRTQEKEAIATKRASLEQRLRNAQALTPVFKNKATVAQ